MAFGWSFPKLALLIALGVLLFWVPLLTLLVILRERHAKKQQMRPTEKEPREPWVR